MHFFHSSSSLFVRDKVNPPLLLSSVGQGVEAVRPCPEEQEGVIRRKCEKTNNRTRGYWPSHSNPEDCVQRVIFLSRDRVRGQSQSFFFPRTDARAPWSLAHVPSSPRCSIFVLLLLPDERVHGRLPAFGRHGAPAGQVHISPAESDRPPDFVQERVEDRHEPDEEGRRGER